jgi:hypothetical protein
MAAVIRAAIATTNSDPAKIQDSDPAKIRDSVAATAGVAGSIRPGFPSNKESFAV